MTNKVNQLFHLRFTVAIIADLPLTLAVFILSVWDVVPGLLYILAVCPNADGDIVPRVETLVYDINLVSSVIK